MLGAAGGAPQALKVQVPGVGPVAAGERCWDNARRELPGFRANETVERYPAGCAYGHPRTLAVRSFDGRC